MYLLIYAPYVVLTATLLLVATVTMICLSQGEREFRGFVVRRKRMLTLPRLLPIGGATPLTAQSMRLVSMRAPRLGDLTIEKLTA
jgi:hypothetical protein